MFGENASYSFLREDNSVVAFELDDETGKMTMHHYVVDKMYGTTPNQIAAAITSGFATATSSIIKYCEAVKLPAIETPVVETITVDEIFEQNFANLNFDADIEAAFQKLYNTGYKNAVGTTLFYNLDKETNQLRIFFDLYRNDTNSLVEIYMPTPQILLDLQNGAKQTVLRICQLDGETQILKGNEAVVIEAVNSAKEQIVAKIVEIANLTAREIKTNSYVRNTTDISNHEDYAEKLFPGKEIITAYVGDMGARLLRPDKFEDTSYISNFKMAFVVKEDGNFEIHEYVCFVPNYEAGTANETLYLRFLNSDNYILDQHKVTVVENPIVAEEPVVELVMHDMTHPVNALDDIEQAVEMLG